MKKLYAKAIITMAVLLLTQNKSKAQITLLQDFSNKNSATIGTYQGIKFREGGFSGLFPIPNTGGKEFWTVSDRGVNVDGAFANPSTCRPTYDKIYAFPSYAPKIHRIRLKGDSVQILQTITIKRPDGTPATGIINPAGFGSTVLEVASTDTVLNCANFNLKTTAKDIWGIDSEGILVDAEGNFWICEEGGPTIWKVNPNGVVLKRYTPYANLAGAQAEDVQIDTCFKYRKNNRGFENIAITPSGKIIAIIQSPILFPNKTIGEGTRIHRILEIDPITNAQRMFVYLNDGIIGASGSNQIRLRDWKLGDMAAINDSTFLVLEAAIRGTSDFRRLYQINLNGATAVKSGYSYGGLTLENLIDSAGLALKGIKAVRKTLVMNLLSNGWPVLLEKAEGLAILNDSTIAIGNDNDYSQFSLLEDGIATATTNTSHVIIYGLKGNSKLKNYTPSKQLLGDGITGPSTSQSPYLKATAKDAWFASILTAGDQVGGYKMTGIPDGAGAYDNGNGTFTMLVNHEIPTGGGVVRAHSKNGAFVSKWTINKSDLSVISGSDLIQNVYLYTPGAGYVLSNTAAKASFGRFCSADLPEVAAFYNSSTALGTQERIFMNGEESGAEGRAFAHILTGTNAGTTYELPGLGKFSWENSVASPAMSNKTIVAGTDDATPGQVYIYVGTKTNAGTEIDKAGLTNGKLFGVAVAGLTTEISGSIPTANTAFTMVDLGNIKDSTGAALDKLSTSKSVTKFLRPEDGAWDPSNANDFYFVTTNSFTAPSRMWRLRFADINNPENGGTITAVLDGTEGQKMMDNIGFDNTGRVLLQEDIGNQTPLGKIWQYNTTTDQLVQVGEHDPTRFLTGGSSFLTQDEESSGIIDAQSILGPGMFLLVDQAHYTIAGEVYEGGQLLALYNPETALMNPEIGVQGNSLNILMADTFPSLSDNTDFGYTSTSSAIAKSFVIRNTGAGPLNITSFAISGTNGSDFSVVGLPSFPLQIGANSLYTLVVRFAPSTVGSKKAMITINSSDYNERNYNFSLAGTAFVSGPTGPSSSQSPYLVGVSTGVSFTSILTAGDAVGSYKMAGIPDGAGAFDNNNGTFTMLVNHEIPSGSGGIRAHGQKGGFVSKWVINKSNLSVASGSDLIKNVYFYAKGTGYTLANTANPNAKGMFSRFCSADLPESSAFYNSITGLGSKERIFLNGEESGTEGRAFAHIVTGSAAGNSYELPALGKYSWENAVASPFMTNKTIVVGTDDATPGQVYVYVGSKTSSGTEVDKAGLNNGKLYGVAVTGLANEVSVGVPTANTPFTLADLGLMQDSTGASLEIISNAKSVTKFLRPEDGAWDPANPADFYFVTTNSFTTPSKLWRLRFTDIANPENGGTITAILDGTEGQKMMDNIGISGSGQILIQEDIGNQAPLGKIWQYNLSNKQLTVLAEHDGSRFLTGGSNFLTQDEEASGIIDAQSILGPGMFLLVDQAHYSISSEVYEGGQILAMFNPTSFNSQSEIAVTGSNVNIVDGDLVPDAADNTDFGYTGVGTIISKTFVIKNTGAGSLNISSIKINGLNASEFSINGTLNFPLVLATNATQSITLNFTPQGNGNRVATLQLLNNDLDESLFDFAVQGQGVTPEINLLSNGNTINSGDQTPGIGNNTDFGWADLSGTGVTKSYQIQNTGLTALKIYSIQIIGNNASDFVALNLPVFPASIAPFSTLNVDVKFTPTATGTRMAKLIVASNDADEGSYEFVIAGNLSTLKNNVIAVENNVHLYPNPANEFTNILVNLSKVSTVQILVKDIQGRIISQNNFNSTSLGENQFKVPTNNLADGLYIVEVKLESGMYPIKLIIKH